MQMPTSQFMVRFSLKYNTLLVDNREGLKKPSRRKSTQILFQYHVIKVEYSLLRQLSLSPWRNGTSKGCFGENIFTKDFCSPILCKILSDNFDKSFQFRPSQYGVIPCSSRRWYRGEGLTARGGFENSSLLSQRERCTKWDFISLLEPAIYQFGWLFFTAFT